MNTAMDSSSTPSAYPRRGFTLVEMLVVIAIIGILAALLVPAISIALWSSKQTKIKMEVNQLASAMELFKSKYGSYPPVDLRNPATNQALRAFVAKAFPRYPIANLNADLTAAAVGIDVVNVNPQRALVFWLSGFSPDPAAPFTGAGQRTPLFDFDKTRLMDASNPDVPATPGTTPIGRIIYNAPYGNTAYAYFDSKSYGAAIPSGQAVPLAPSFAQPLYADKTSRPVSVNYTGTPVSIQTQISNGSGVVVPYIADDNASTKIDQGEDFAKPQSFQIISAGQDGDFGWSSATTPPTGGRLYPTGIDYDLAPTSADDDNVTNFCDKSNLEAAKP